MTVVILPWPDARLSPNARVHWRAKAPVAKNARAAAWAATKGARASVTHDGPIPLQITLRAPDRRHRDRDNVIAMLKAAMDGIADGLGVNDRRFEPIYRWGEPVKGGCVEVAL